MAHPLVENIERALRGITLTPEDAEAIICAVQVRAYGRKTTFNSFFVSLDTAHDMPLTQTILAEYYKIENGWVTFKDADHKVLADFPAGRVQMIKRGASVTAD